METIQSWLAGAAEHRRRHGRPLVSLCYAQSLDGCIAARRGQPTALSGPESTRLTHRLRLAHDAILVGVGTVIADNPKLTARVEDPLSSPRNPQPVVLDSRLRLPHDCYLLQEHPLKAWVAATPKADSDKAAALQSMGARLLILPADPMGNVQLPALLVELAKMGVNSLMVEGGAQVITAFLAQGLVDQVVLTITPVFLGGLPAFERLQRGEMRRPIPLKDVSFESQGQDIIVWGRIA